MSEYQLKNSKKVFIIAEAGVNHNGLLRNAMQLISAAKAAGVNAVKFQTFITELNITRSAPRAEYQKDSTKSTGSQFDLVKPLELDRGSHEQLQALAQELGIEFMSTAFDLPSVEMLSTLGIRRYKIPSGEITNLPFLRHVGGKAKPIILSTGMATLEEIGAALEVLEKAGTAKKDITVLHCNTEYPTPMEDVNLNAMLTIRDTFGVDVGYSDHTLGIEVPVAAVALGAKVIEKHFTLDRNLPGPDHRASLEPYELKAMVDAIRNIEHAMGDGDKRPSASEAKNIPIARKSLVAVKTIRRGEAFTAENVAAKRPGTGISPMCWDEVLGRVASRDFEADELIEF